MTSSKNQTFDPKKWSMLLETAAGEVFEMMLGCELKPNRMNTKKRHEITAVVGLAGQLCGVFSVKCSARTAAIMTAAMLGGDSDSVDQQACDGIGELCNMVAGNFKSKLAGIGDRCMLSVPTVVSGSDYAVSSMAGGQRLEVSVLFKDEPLWIALELDS